MRLILINFQNTVLSSSLTGKLGFNVFGLKREYWLQIKCGVQFVKFCKLSGDQGSQAPVGPCSVIRKYKIVKVFSNFVEYFQPRRLQIFTLLVSITLQTKHHKYWFDDISIHQSALRLSLQCLFSVTNFMKASSTTCQLLSCVLSVTIHVGGLVIFIFLVKTCLLSHLFYNSNLEFDHRANLISSSEK